MHTRGNAPRIWICFERSEKFNLPPGRVRKSDAVVSIDVLSECEYRRGAAKEYSPGREPWGIGTVYSAPLGAEEP